MTVLSNAERLAHEAMAAASGRRRRSTISTGRKTTSFSTKPTFRAPITVTLFPYFDEILRALSPPDPCRTVTSLSSAQIGKTTVGNIFACGALTMGRGTVLYCHPIDDNARRWSRMKLGPLMRATPIIAAQFPQRARDGADNVLFKERRDGLSQDADYRRQFSGILVAGHCRIRH